MSGALRHASGRNLRKKWDGIRKIREKGSDHGEGPLKFQVLKDTNFE